MRTALIILLFVTGLSELTYAQIQEVDRHKEIGFGIGGMNYTGDLSPNYSLKFYRPGGQFFYRHNFHDHVSVLRFNLLIGQLYADESKLSSALQLTN